MATPPPSQFVGTINALFAESVRRNPDREALTSKRGKEWVSLSYAEVQARQKALSLGLRALGIAPGDRVALLSENRPEWAISDLAILAIGAVTVPVYPTLPPGQVAHILADSGARALIASDAKQLRKAIETRERTPGIEFLVTMEEVAAESDLRSFDSLLRAGSDAAATVTPSFEQLRDSVAPDDLASLIYTSGTTGDPKGAMLTHANLFAAARLAQDALPFDISRDVFLSFLPLCHVFERVTYYLALGMGVNTYYAESIFKVQENMVDVKPTLMQSVPRLYEAIYERVLDGVAKAPEKRRKAFRWGMSVGVAYSKRRNAGRMVTPLLAAQHLVADKTVLSKVRERLGGRWRFFVSGGAPLSSATAEFFQGIGIPIVEGYGLTETTAAVCANPVGRAKIGTVGKPMPHVQVRIADDGEILAAGPTIMKGYWNRPDATAESIDAKGWFHTGDIGSFDSDGYLSITDRKKDIIVLANGKKVAPQPIENHLKSSPMIAEAVLLGDKAGTVGALVVPNFEHLGDWAKQNGTAYKDSADLAATTDARKRIKQEIDALSSDLADFEKIRKVALLDHALSIDSGELTPTLKVKRKVVQERYGHLLD